MRQVDWDQVQKGKDDLLSLDERGTSFMTVMVIMLMTGSLGVAALTMTGMENSMAGSIRMVEEGTDAAEACIGMAVNVIKGSVDSDNNLPAKYVAPAGPVPAANQLFTYQEIVGTNRDNPDVAVGAGNAPNIVMNVNNYVVNGDIDFLYSNHRAGSDDTTYDYFYRIDCTAANAANGATSHVIAVFDCLFMEADSCHPRAL